MTISRYFLRVIAFISLVAIMCGFFSIAHAQSVGITALDITLETNPETPGPKEQVTATLVSYSINLNNYQISWFVDRVLVKTGVGLTNFTFTTAAAGSTTQVEAQIMVDGQTISKIMQVSPTAVDILWEADTYVPPFYKGKKLPTRQASVTLTAIPQFKNPTVDSIRTAVYYWNRDFNPVPTSSGYAKQSFTFENSAIKPTENLGVTVRNRTETEIATKEEDLIFKDPVIIFYEKEGSRIFERRGSRAGFQVESNRFNLIAVPYFFAFDNPLDITFDWLADGQSLTVNNNNPSEILFELPESGRQTTVSLSIESIPKLLQTASRNLQLMY